jgi:zinc protease
MRTLSTLTAIALALPLQAATLETMTLDNGLEVVVCPVHTSPVVTICVTVRTGATCEEPGTNGLAHFYEHMFFKGNAALPDQTAYNRRIRELGIVRNGVTSDEMVRYYVTLGSHRFPEGMEFMYDAIVTPLFDPEEMERERQVIMNEYERNTTGAWWHFWLAQEQVLAPAAPWRASAIGVPEVILSATPETMHDFRERYYTPDNAVLIIAGDVDTGTAFEAAAGIFSSWEYGGRSNFDDLPVLLSVERDTTVYVESPAGIAYVSAVFAGPPFGEYPGDSYPADVWGTYLDLMSREFYADLVTTGPFTDVHASYFTQRYFPTISFGGMAPAGRIEEAKDALLREIEEMLSPDYYDPEGIELAKDRLRRHRLYTEESSRDLAIESIPFWWVQGGGLDYYETYLDSLALVETADIVDFLDRWVAGKPRAVFLMTPDAGTEGM